MTGLNRPVADGLAWLESAATLLSEPDPGPTPFLVEDLIVDQAICAIQGPHKSGKTWLELELAVAVVTGRDAFDRFAVPHPGPVILVLEESGRDALHRRLDAMRRGHALATEALRDLHFAANMRVRLDDPDWRYKLCRAAIKVQPRAIMFDPLVRLKGAGVDENAQKEMAPILDFMRDLRDGSDAAVIFTHHSGHEGGRLRGTSDLEAYWESKITLKRDGTVCELASEHREAEAGRGLRYGFDWHDESRSVRLSPLDAPPQDDTLHDKALISYVLANPGLSTGEVAKGLGRRRTDTASRLRTLDGVGTAHGTVYRSASQRPDALGRLRRFDAWFADCDAGSSTVPDGGTLWDAERSGSLGVPVVGGPIRPPRDAGPDGAWDGA